MIDFLTKSADTVYTFRILRLLTTPWNQLKAYKLGLIDDEGNVVRKPETSDEKSAYNLLHRLVFNLKKMLNKIPFGKTTIASYMAALYLLKEESGMSDHSFTLFVEELSDSEITDLELEKSGMYLLEETDRLQPGEYVLLEDHFIPKTGERLAKAGTTVLVENNESIFEFGGILVFEAMHLASNRKIFVTQYSLTR